VLQIFKVERNYVQAYSHSGKAAKVEIIPLCLNTLFVVEIERVADHGTKSTIVSFFDVRGII
jgi:hypothetical protein